MIETRIEVLIRYSQRSIDKQWLKLSNAVRYHNEAQLKDIYPHLMGTIYYQRNLKKELKKLTTPKARRSLQFE